MRKLGGQKLLEACAQVPQNASCSTTAPSSGPRLDHGCGKANTATLTRSQWIPTSLQMDHLDWMLQLFINVHMDIRMYILVHLKCASMNDIYYIYIYIMQTIMIRICIYICIYIYIYPCGYTVFPRRHFDTQYFLHPSCDADSRDAWCSPAPRCLGQPKQIGW